MNILEYENYHEDKTHSDPSFPYNTYLCSIPLDFCHVPLHWHDEMELIYIKKGTGSITLDFQQYVVHSNTIILIFPGQLHSLSQYESYSFEYENIIFDPNMLISKKTDNCNNNYLLPLIDGSISVAPVFSSEHPEYNKLIAPIDFCDQINAVKPQGYELYIKSQLYQFFFILINRCNTS